MGADAFFGFFGIKFALDPDDEEAIGAVESGTDPRCVKAKRADLQTHFGQMTEGEDCFLYVGQRLAWLGLEHDSHVELGIEQIGELQTRVGAKLVEAGFAEKPAFHFQFEAQY
jgi:hypothetical protein